MTYIKLEDVNKIINEWVEEYELHPMKERINSLPQYNPEDGWISTAIQLPPEDTNVLIFEGGQSNLSGWNEPKIGWYNKKFGFQSLTDYLIATHWMPLPLPPITK